MIQPQIDSVSFSFNLILIRFSPLCVCILLIIDCYRKTLIRREQQQLRACRVNDVLVWVDFLPTSLWPTDHNPVTLVCPCMLKYFLSAPVQHVQLCKRSAWRKTVRKGSSDEFGCRQQEVKERRDDGWTQKNKARFIRVTDGDLAGRGPRTRSKILPSLPLAALDDAPWHFLQEQKRLCDFKCSYVVDFSRCVRCCSNWKQINVLLQLLHRHREYLCCKRNKCLACLCEASSFLHSTDIRWEIGLIRSEWLSQLPAVDAPLAQHHSGHADQVTLQLSDRQLGSEVTTLQAASCFLTCQMQPAATGLVWSLHAKLLYENIRISRVIRCTQDNSRHFLDSLDSNLQQRQNWSGASCNHRSQCVNQVPIMIEADDLKLFSAGMTPDVTVKNFFTCVTELQWARKP